MDDNNSLENINNQEMGMDMDNDNTDGTNNDNADDIIAQAEAPMIQEGFEESGNGEETQSSNRRRGNTVQNQMILGIGDNAYEIMDETGERVYIEFLEFLNCL